MGESAAENESSVAGLKNVMENTKGFERSLNQAINFVVADLDSYLTITDRIQSSIDKILAKSKFVVGNIDDYEDLEKGND